MPYSSKLLTARNRVLAVLGMGKISKKGIMKEGYKKSCPASEARFDVIITHPQKSSTLFVNFFSLLPTIQQQCYNFTESESEK